MVREVVPPRRSVLTVDTYEPVRPPSETPSAQAVVAPAAPPRKVVDDRHNRRILTRHDTGKALPFWKNAGPDSARVGEAQEPMDGRRASEPSGDDDDSAAPEEDAEPVPSPLLPLPEPLPAPELPDVPAPAGVPAI